MSGAEHEYDVCLSFAGEQRDYVHSVAETLKANGIRVFYDGYEEVNLWGKDLTERLDEVYQNGARHCVIFVSADYEKKMWTSYERRSAFARALKDSSDYLLPVRFDNTPIQGLRDSIGFIDLRHRTPEALAELIIKKVSPRQQMGAQQQAEPKPACWEYRLLGDTMLDGKRRLAPRYRDHTHHRAAPNSMNLDLAESAKFLRAAYRRVDDIIKEVSAVFAEENQARALGDSTRPGDADAIRQLGGRLVGVFEALLDWAARVRGVTMPDRMTTARELLAQVADRPLADIARFIDDYAARADELSGATTATRVEISLDLATDDLVTSRFASELAAATEA
jgi:hypothetical protein